MTAEQTNDQNTGFDRIESERVIRASAMDIFAVLTDPQGHVAIDASGMLMDATGDRVAAVGDTFVVHMDREALGDFPLGEYDVTVTIATFVPDVEVSWTILGRLRPQIGHVYGYRLEPTADGATKVTSFYDWSDIHPEWREKNIFPVIHTSSLAATLGILDRTVRRGYPRETPRT
ncbi:polyketide cyclase [Williamsia sp.]|uniref:polyketide cyclase n=1 Tax=Williamsia sp. TaxID=1872085 RepID=UPI002F9372C8